MTGTQLQIACLVCRRPVDAAEQHMKVGMPMPIGGVGRIHQLCLVNGREAPKRWLDVLIAERVQLAQLLTESNSDE